MAKKKSSPPAAPTHIEVVAEFSTTIPAGLLYGKPGETYPIHILPPALLAQLRRDGKIRDVIPAPAPLEGDQENG